MFLTWGWMELCLGNVPDFNITNERDAQVLVLLWDKRFSWSALQLMALKPSCPERKIRIALIPEP